MKEARSGSRCLRPNMFRSMRESKVKSISTVTTSRNFIQKVHQLKYWRGVSNESRISPEAKWEGIKLSSFLNNNKEWKAKYLMIQGRRKLILRRCKAWIRTASQRNWRIIEPRARIHLPGTSFQISQIIGRVLETPNSSKEIGQSRMATNSYLKLKSWKIEIHKTPISMIYGTIWDNSRKYKWNLWGHQQINSSTNSPKDTGSVASMFNHSKRREDIRRSCQDQDRTAWEQDDDISITPAWKSSCLRSCSETAVSHSKQGHKTIPSLKIQNQTCSARKLDPEE